MSTLWLNENRASRWLLPVWVAAAAMMLRPAVVVAQGCAMCATLVGGPGDPLGKGLNTSIMFLMAMPFTLTAIVGGWIVYMYRRRNDRHQSVGRLEPRREGAS